MLIGSIVMRASGAHRRQEVPQVSRFIPDAGSWIAIQLEGRKYVREAGY